MRVLYVVGARPQFIKLAPLVGEMDGIVVHTGQHYDKNMSRIFFDEMGIKEPDYNIGVGSASHGEQTGKMMIELERVVDEEKPDIVTVFGDTNSTLAGALVSSKLNIPLAHIEAGLRSFDKRMPEEINRILTDHCSDILFCPTETAVDNLKNEGIESGVYNVGDIMYDSCLHFLEMAEKKSDILSELNLEKNDYFLATVHRPSNVDHKEKLKIILDALNHLSSKVVLPLHPRTEKMIKKFGLNSGGNIRMVDPVGYLDMLMLEKNAKLILTDSGGVQKEAYFMKNPCVTLRDSTEWVETLGNGNVLTDIKEDEIIEKVENMQEDGFDFSKNFYGDGQSSKKIAGIVNDKFHNDK